MTTSEMANSQISTMVNISHALFLLLVFWPLLVIMVMLEFFGFDQYITHVDKHAD
jgi:hypothetical protein